MTQGSISVMPANRRYRYDVEVVTWDHEAIMAFTENDEQKVRFTEVKGSVPALKEASTLEPILPPGMRLSNRRGGRGGGRGGSRDSGMESDRSLSTSVSSSGSRPSASPNPRLQAKRPDEVVSALPSVDAPQATGGDDGSKKKRNRKKKGANDLAESGHPRLPSAAAQVTIDGITNDCSKDEDEVADVVAKSSYASSVISFDDGAALKEGKGPDRSSSDVKGEMEILLRDYYAGKFSVFPMTLDELSKEKDLIYKYVKKLAVPRSMVLADFQLNSNMLFPSSFLLELGTIPTGDEVLMLKEPSQDAQCSRLLTLGPPCSGFIIGIRS